ncbi:MAG: PH domain-containing protein [Anaerolineales bacterium]
MAKTYVETMLGETEKVEWIARQHWFLLLSSILAEIVIILGLAVGLGLLIVVFPLAVVLYILILIPGAKGVYDFMVWWNRQFVITNRRVIQVSGIFNKSVTDSSLEKVTDLKLEQTALGRLFNYGDIEILTASELGVNLFRQIADPIRFKTKMLDAKERMGGNEDMPRPQGRQDVPAMLAELDDLRRKGVLTEQEFQEKKAKLLARL